MTGHLACPTETIPWSPELEASSGCYVRGSPEYFANDCAAVDDASVKSTSACFTDSWYW